MSFVLPTTNTVVDKYGERDLFSANRMYKSESRENIWETVEKYKMFRELVVIAQMEGILRDPQSQLTVFVPLDFGEELSERKRAVFQCPLEGEVLDVNFETARVILNSLILPSIVSTTMMMQSAFMRYQTRHSINTLTFSTPHCVQFEPHTFNKPPFGIVINGRSRILTPDVRASNGLVHTLDKFPYPG